MELRLEGWPFSTVVWMIGVYVGYIWQRSTEGDIDFGKFFGFLSFKYKETGSNVIGHINALDIGQ